MYNMFRSRPKFRKLNVHSKDDIPERIEVQQCLGLTLAQVLFDYSHRDTKKVLGLTTTSKCPEGSFWIAPKDHIKEKNVLSLVENDVIKAYTHEGILDIGYDLLQKFQEEVEKKTRDEIEDEYLDKYYTLEAEKRRALEVNTDEMKKECEKRLQHLREDFEEFLVDEREKLRVACNKEKQIATIKERMRVTEEMLTKMRDEACYIISSLYEDFTEKYLADRDNIIADFNEIMRKTHVKMKEETIEMERRKEEALRVQKNELQLQNTADIMYVLCLERLRNSSEKHALHTYFEDKISGLEKLIFEQHEKITAAAKQIKEDQKEKQLLEESLYRVIKEFQKFISFVLHSSDEETEFLLPSSIFTSILSQFHERNANYKKNQEKMEKDMDEYEKRVADILKKYLTDEREHDASTNASDDTHKTVKEKKKSVTSPCACKNCAHNYVETSIRSLNTYKSIPCCTKNNIIPTQKQDILDICTNTDSNVNSHPKEENDACTPTDCNLISPSKKRVNDTCTAEDCNLVPAPKKISETCTAADCNSVPPPQEEIIDACTNK